MHKHEHLRSNPLPATPELAGFIDHLLAHEGFSPDTSILELRQAIFGQDLYMSRNGELMFRQDRASLVIELDELIDTRGGDQPARRLVTNTESETQLASNA